MTARGAVIAVGAVAALTLPLQAIGGNHLNHFSPHPGTIRTVNEYDGSVELVRAEEASDRIKFVYLDRNGVEVEPAAAAERIPIIEVRITSTDGNGNPVPKEKAQLIRLHEFGPGGRLLRSAILTPN